MTTARATKPPLMGTAREWGIDIAVGVGIGVLLGLMGPFGSFFNDKPPQRIAYWVGGITFGMILFGLLARLAGAGARRIGAPDWTMIPVVILIGSAIQAPPLRMIAVALWPQIEQAVSPLTWYGQCVATTTPIVLAYYFIRVRPHARAHTRTLAREGQVPALAPAVAADPGGVLYLKMEDHYVRIRTDHGSRLEMGPLARVTAGLSGVEGLQVHRSWWVARRAIAGVERDGRNLHLRLADGEKAPVSRASVAKLRAAGWLAEENAL